MKLRATLVLGLLVAASGSVWAQTTTVQTDDNRLVITGDVVRVDPGRMIVIREKGDKVVTYTLAPSLTLPGDVAVGRRVTLYTERGDTGSVVTRVTTSVTPEGDVQRTTETTRTSPGGDVTKTTTTTITGKVQTYDTGKSITLVRPDGTTVTYTINDRSRLPADLVVGKEVEIHTLKGSDDAVIERVTYITTKNGKTKTKTKEKVIS